MRFLQDIQVGDIKPSNDGMSAAFLHSAEFTLKAKEIIQNLLPNETICISSEVMPEIG